MDAAEKLVASLSDEEVQAYLEAIRKADELERTKGGIYRLFPDEGPFARALYSKHMEFFALGLSKPFRMFGGGNGTGKTFGCGGYETVCHLTGIYPEWWPGFKFTRAINAWAAGVDNKTLRESLQPALIGEVGQVGTGLIPGHLIVDIAYKSNTNGVIDYILVMHVSGVPSKLVVKSYEEGRESFQAANVDWIWLDEEPKPEIYTECVQRFRGETANGQLILTFTPLKGISDVVSMFLPKFAQCSDQEYEESGRGHVICAWEDVPHLSETERKRKLANALPHEKDARSKGIPSIGPGKIYPVSESDFIIKPLKSIPAWWPRVYGMDVGWNKTAAIWGAWDQEADVVYLYSEYYRGEVEPAIHAAGIRARGVWIPGVIDPASDQRNQKDGDNLLTLYRDLGLRLRKADNSVDVGLLDVLNRLNTDRLKVFETCQNWITEFRVYRRDEKGKVVKVRDHLMDATRYLIRSGLQHATLRADTNRSLPTGEKTFGIYGD